VSDGLAGVGNVRGLIYLCAFQLDVGESLPAADPGRAPPGGMSTSRRDTSTCAIPNMSSTTTARPTSPPGHQLASRTSPSPRGVSRSVQLPGGGSRAPTSSAPRTRRSHFLQEHMASRAGQRLSLEASHSPFLSQPGSVANLLRGVLEQVSRA
jgi:hypothetical protein